MIDTNCARPFHFENDSQDYRLSGQGTGFFVHYKDHVYGITARHVIKDFHPRQYRMFRRLSNTQPIECFFYETPFTGENRFGEDIYDFVVIPITDSLEDVQRDIFVWPLLERQPIPNVGERIWVDGFPDDYRVVDHDTKASHFQAAILQTVAEKQVDVAVYRLRVTSAHTLTTFSGFSGSPAYIVPRRNGTMNDTRIFGVTIRGTPESGCIFVIGIQAVKVLIDGYLASAVKEAGGTAASAA